MAVHQCPRCPLRFDLAPMLADHLSTDHRAAPEEVIGLLPPGATGRGPGPRPDHPSPGPLPSGAGDAAP